jgi:hypothetical protein
MRRTEKWIMSIVEPPFPLWVLVQRGDSVWRPVMQSPGLAVGFSHQTRAGDFLRAASNPAWEVRLVVRVTWAALVENFQQQGASGLTIDPDANGHGSLVTFQSAET